jgi:hypothetical protein
MIKHYELANTIFGDGQENGRETTWLVNDPENTENDLEISAWDGGARIRYREANNFAGNGEIVQTGSDITDALNRLYAFIAGAVFALRRVHGADRDTQLNRCGAARDVIEDARERWLRALNG